MKRKEDQLIILGAKFESLPGDQKKIEILLSEEIDWNYLFHSTIRQCTLPLFLRTINHLPLSVIPALHAQAFNTENRKIFKTNLVLLTEMFRFIKILEDQGIKSICFKGPVLAAMNYSDPGLRQFTDLDFAVENADLAQKAKNILLSHGYRLADEMNGVQEFHYLQTQCEYHLVNSQGTIFIDLHWQIFHSYFSFPFSLSEAFSRLTSVQIFQRPVLTFCPEDLLLILCAHGTKHLWEKLSLVCDVFALIQRNPSLNWDQVQTRAKKLGSERMLLLGVSLTQILFQAELPPEITRKIQHGSRIFSLARKISKRMFKNPPEEFGLLEEFFFLVKCKERAWDRIRFSLLGSFTPSMPDFLLFPLPKVLFPLYYFLRPIRLLYQTFFRE